MILKKILVIFIVLLLLGINLLSSIDSRKINTNIKMFFEAKSKTSVFYINASSSYDYGWKAGIQFSLQYKLLDLLLFFTKKAKVSSTYIENQINTMEQFCPSFIEELKGLSDSTGIKVERLIAAQIIFHSFLGGACTVTASTGNATKNNETYLTENFDSKFDNRNTYRFNLFRFLMILIIRSYTWRWNRIINIARPGLQQYKYAFIGIPVIGETTLLNEKGLGYGGTGTHLTNNKSRYIDEGSGILPYLLSRHAMRTCKNVFEVANLFQNSKRAADKNKVWPHDYDYDSFIYCDREGNILVIQQTHSHIITVFGNSTDITGASEGILWHSNHHQWLDANLTGSIYPGEEGVKNSSFVRAARARELLEMNYGNITLDVCKSITRDHGQGSNENGKDSWDICRHPDKNDFSVTLYSWIVVPKKMTVYWTFGSPCISKFVERDFSKIF